MTPIVCDAEGPRPMTEAELAAYLASMAAAVPVRRIISAADFLRRVTPEEYAALLQDPAIAYAWAGALARGRIDLDSPEIGPLLDRAVAAGVLSAARRDELLRDVGPAEAP